MGDRRRHRFLVVRMHPAAVVVDHVVDIVQDDQVSRVAVVLDLLYYDLHVDYPLDPSH